MHNDSIETLLLRHYGSSAPVPVDLEQQLQSLVLQEKASVQAHQRAVTTWQERRVSRRRLLQLVTLSGSAGMSVVAVGLNAIQGRQKPAFSA